METHVVETIKGSLLGLGAGMNAVGVGMTISQSLQLLFASVVSLVAGVDSLGIAADGVVAIHVWVFTSQVGLVEVVCVGDVATTKTSIDNEGSVGTNKHGDAASTASRASITLLVQGDVASNYDCVPSIPGGGLEPVECVEKRIGATVAGVDGIHTFNVGVSRLFEELHENRLDGLGLVQKGLSTNLQTTNRGGVDAVLLEERGDSGQSEGVDVCIAGKRLAKFFSLRLGVIELPTFAVVAETHLGLAEANGVFTLADAIEGLQVGLVDTLRRRDAVSIAVLKLSWANKRGRGIPGWGSKALWL